jgi:hypothetical protein
MIRITRVSEIYGLQCNRVWKHVITLPRRSQVGARELALAGKGIASKQVIRSAIFLYDDDYVLEWCVRYVLSVGEG